MDDARPLRILPYFCQSFRSQSRFIFRAKLFLFSSPPYRPTPLATPNPFPPLNSPRSLPALAPPPPLAPPRPQAGSLARPGPPQPPALAAGACLAPPPSPPPDSVSRPLFPLARGPSGSSPRLSRALSLSVLSTPAPDFAPPSPLFFAWRRIGPARRPRRRHLRHARSDGGVRRAGKQPLWVCGGAHYPERLWHLRPGALRSLSYSFCLLFGSGLSVSFGPPRLSVSAERGEPSPLRLLSPNPS